MLRSPGRLTVLVAGAATAAVAVTGTFLLAPPRQAAEIPVPPTDASPEEVVTAFLDALNAHDCETAEALVTEESKELATDWCHDIESLTGTTVRPHRTEPSDDPRSESVRVPALFDVNLRPFHGDGSLDQGTAPRTYLLERDSSGSPWRIVDQVS